ncbi:MAG: DnaA/Hda family protein [Sumerlaeia bacterium]
MKTKHSETVIRQVLDGLDVLDVLEFIDYFPGSMQRGGGKIRCSCPLHGEEEESRSMMLDEETKTYQCTEPGCKGQAGGNLIDLFAGSRGVTFDQAVKSLCDEFGIEIALPEDLQKLDQHVDAAEAFVGQMDTETGPLGPKAKAIVAKLEEVLSFDPNHVRALRVLLRLKKKGGEDGAAALLVTRLADAELGFGNDQAAIDLLTGELEADPSNRAWRRKLAEVHLKREEAETAAQHLMLLADAAEEAGDLQEALWAYRQVEANASSAAIDVRPMITQLLVTTGQSGKAARELVAEARDAEDRGDLQAACDALEQAAQVEPSSGPVALRYVEIRILQGLTPETLNASLRLVDNLLGAAANRPAVEALVKLVSASPDSTAVLERLVIAYQRLNRPDLSTEARYRLAETHRRAGAFAEAHSVLDDILEADPSAMKALRAHAHISLGANDKEGRVRWLAKCVKQTPDDAQIIEEYGDALDAVGRQNDAQVQRLRACRRFLEDNQEGRAEELLKRCVAAGAKDPQALELLADLQESRNHLAEARSTRLTLAEIRRDANDRPGALQLIDHLIRSGAMTSEDIARAEGILRQMLKSEPDDVGLHKRLAALLRAAGRHAAADDQIYELIAVHDRRNEVDEAGHLFRGLIKRDGNDMEVRQKYADFLRRHHRHRDASKQLLSIAERKEAMGEPDGAYAMLHEALLVDPENDLAQHKMAEMAKKGGVHKDETIRRLLDMAIAHTESRRFREAAKALSEAVNIDPDNIVLRRKLIDVCLDDNYSDIPTAMVQFDAIANIRQKEGDKEGALAARREAAALNPDDVDRRRALAEALHDAGLNHDALEEVMNLADYHRSAGEFEDALESLGAALEIDKDHIPARRMRAEIYEETGDVQKALREWRTLAPLMELKADEIPRAGSSDMHHRPASLQVMKEYDFDHFVVGDHNRFAWATAQAVAKSPGNTPHNPLFLHSDVGMGKTHILHAIANYVLDGNPGIKIIYTNAEDFTSELIDAIQNNQVIQFRQKHKAAELLLLDDAHLLAGKESSQEEFFHIFNTLYQSKRQIVITSDRPPKEIAHLEKRLMSRFGAGVIVEIQAPQLETRMAILRRVAMEREDLNVPDDALNILAEAITSNVRELKGAFNQLIIMHEMGGAPLNAETAKKVAEQLAAPAAG